MLSNFSNTSNVYQNNPFVNNSSKQFKADFGSSDFNKTKNNFRATNRNFSINPPKNNQYPQEKKIYKDPDIWDPP